MYCTDTLYIEVFSQILYGHCINISWHYKFIFNQLTSVYQYCFVLPLLSKVKQTPLEAKIYLKNKYVLCLHLEKAISEKPWKTTNKDI